MSDIQQLIEKYALQNAIKQKQAPQVGAVMGKLMGNHADLRSRSKEITPIIKEVVDSIASGDLAQWEERLNSIAPELIEELSVKKEVVKGLKELETNGKPVIMRFAPNPNGPPTMGSARGIVVNSEYAKRYGGTFIIRFDDTDPVTKRPMLDAYTWYLDDCEWIGAKPDKVIYASDRIPLYYEYARKLIEMGHAYVCFCGQGTFKTLKDSKTACLHRDISVEENLAQWEKMLAGGYDEKSAVLRIKTDIEHKDPAIRDWGAFRIVKKDHPRPEVGEKYAVWPLLDFESAIEDHELGITHIIRGKDLMDSETRQTYIYRYFGWEYPKTMHWGRVKMHEFGKFSTSQLRKDIEAGVYTGWDDPRLPTLRAIRRRGIRPETIRKFMLDLGIGETDISLSLDTLYAENRKLVDSEANRYFFVWDPVKIEIEGADATISTPLLHPADAKRGQRTINAGTSLYVCKDDLASASVGDKFRLKDLYNIEITSISPLTVAYIGTDIELVKSKQARIIHWAPIDGIPATVISPDGTYEGICEDGVVAELDKVIQFERFGFVRIDSVDGDVVAYFTHK